MVYQGMAFGDKHGRDFDMIFLFLYEDSKWKGL